MILAASFIDLFTMVILVLLIVILLWIVFKIYPVPISTKIPLIPKKAHLSIKSSSLYDAEIYKMLCQIQRDTTACKVIVARFHNGGSFRNGLDMEKFSVTHETPLGSPYPLQDRCIGMLNSRYGSAFLQLATCGDYCISDINDCPDPNFKQDMKYYEFLSTYLFLIKQFDGSDEGFVGINFRFTTVLTGEQRNKVQSYIPRLLGLINMREEDLKNKFQC